MGRPRVAATATARGRRVPLRWLAISFLLLPALWGCALMPHRGAPALPAPTQPPAPETTPERIPERIPHTTPTPAPSDPAAAAAPGDSILQITVQLSEEERDRLSAQADEDSRLAWGWMDRVDAARMTPESSKRLEAARELLVNAADARARDDVRSAALLARKARILAEGLPRE